MIRSQKSNCKKKEKKTHIRGWMGIKLAFDVDVDGPDFNATSMFHPHNGRNGFTTCSATLLKRTPLNAMYPNTHIFGFFIQSAT